MATAAGERALVVTVCGALPPSRASSALTNRIHAVRGFRDGTAYVSARREEDRAAAAILGAQTEWGGSLDAIYRNPGHYAHSASLLGPPAPGDPLARETAALIEDLRRRFPGAQLFAPLGVSGHIDHRGVSQAARTVDPGVLLYEEFPHRGAPVTGAAARTREIVGVAPAFVDAWVNAVLCYRSQLRPLFGDEPSARAALIAHAKSTGGTVIWRL